MIEAGYDWLAANGPPNGWFLLAVLTRPVTWSRAAVDLARKRIDALGSSD